MTAEEFAALYARESGTTVAWLREHGREPRPCDCREIGCEGWQMAHVSEEAAYVAAGEPYGWSPAGIARWYAEHAKPAPPPAPGQKDAGG